MDEKEQEVILVLFGFEKSDKISSDNLFSFIFKEIFPEWFIVEIGIKWNVFEDISN